MYLQVIVYDVLFSENRLHLQWCMDDITWLRSYPANTNRLPERSQNVNRNVTKTLQVTLRERFFGKFSLRSVNVTYNVST